MFCVCRKTRRWSERYYLCRELQHLPNSRHARAYLRNAVHEAQIIPNKVESRLVAHIQNAQDRLRQELRISFVISLLRCVGVCPYTSAMQSRSLSFVNVLGADRLPTHIFTSPPMSFFFCAMVPNRLIAKKKKRAGNGVYTQNKRDADVGMRLRLPIL